MPVTKYIWDEDNLLAEADGSDVVQTVYTNEPEQYGNLISTRLPIAGTPTTVYHHFDALGSTRQLTNAAGSVTDTAIYDAWGNVVSRTGTTDANLLWIGEVGYYFDIETAQICVRKRVYGPLIARWSAVDPIGLAEAISRYIYAKNAPTVRVDPSGLRCFVCGGPAFQYRVPVDALNDNFIGKPYSALAVIVQGQVQGDINTQGFGTTVPLPKATGPNVVKNKAGTTAFGYFFFTISWPICFDKQ